MEDSISIEIEALSQALTYLPPCELVKILTFNPHVTLYIFTKDLLYAVAVNNGLPYYHNVNLEQLCKFQNMREKDLVIYAAEIEMKE